jgi:uncharacterized YigZ family protein
MEEDMYRTIAAPSQGLFKSKGSRFLSFAYPVETSGEIKNHLQLLKTEYHDARHHCYAYVLGIKGDQFRANDDREPSGTAGKPILGQIHSFNLTNVMVNVVRYFGGTLLGTSGLIEAYKSAAHESLSNSEIIVKTANRAFQINFEYSMMNEVLRLIREEKATVVSKEFMESGSMHIAIRLTRADLFKEKLSHLKGITILESRV